MVGESNGECSSMLGRGGWLCEVTECVLGLRAFGATGGVGWLEDRSEESADDNNNYNNTRWIIKLNF